MCGRLPFPNSALNPSVCVSIMILIDRFPQEGDKIIKINSKTSLNLQLKGNKNHGPPILYIHSTKKSNRYCCINLPTNNYIAHAKFLHQRKVANFD